MPTTRKSALKHKGVKNGGAYHLARDERQKITLSNGQEMLIRITGDGESHRKLIPKRDGYGLPKHYSSA